MVKSPSDDGTDEGAAKSGRAPPVLQCARRPHRGTWRGAALVAARVSDSNRSLSARRCCALSKVSSRAASASAEWAKRAAPRAPWRLLRAGLPSLAASEPSAHEATPVQPAWRHPSDSACVPQGESRPA